MRVLGANIQTKYLFVCLASFNHNVAQGGIHGSNPFNNT
jgi:hypothetical protein